MPFPARFPGQCARTGARINPGDTIASAGRGRYYLVSRGRAPADAAETVDPDLVYAGALDPDLASSDPDGAAAAGRYLRHSMARGVSHVWNSGGREYYRNRAGRCEDAPCCGCCNV